MHRIVKTGYVDMAHRIRGHEGKCRFLHGHTWKIELSVSCEDDQLNALGMVVDFGILAEHFFQPIQDFFDHSCILGKDDETAILAGQHETPEGVVQRHSSLDHLTHDLYAGPGFSAHGAKLNVKFLDFNITAETLSKHLFEMALVKLHALQPYGVKVDYVRVYEQLHPTESYAEYRPDMKC